MSASQPHIQMTCRPTQRAGGSARDTPQPVVDTFVDAYRAHHPQLFRYVNARLGQRQEAEDVTNAVFEKAYAAVGHCRPSPAGFSSWLYTIARNTLIDHYRRRRLPIEAEAEQELLHVRDPTGGPEELLLADEVRRALYDAILELTDEQRQVIGCRFFFNLSVIEVAGLLGKTEGAVKALQSRALGRLQRRLAPGITGG